MRMERATVANVAPASQWPSKPLACDPHPHTNQFLKHNAHLSFHQHYFKSKLWTLLTPSIAIVEMANTRPKKQDIFVGEPFCIFIVTPPNLAKDHTCSQFFVFGTLPLYKKIHKLLSFSSLSCCCSNLPWERLAAGATGKREFHNGPWFERGFFKTVLDLREVSF